jgi:hypothetical protein
MSDELAVNVEALYQAAHELSGTADRLEAAVNTHLAALRPAPAGREEVSVGVANWVASAAGSFEPHTRRGIAELRNAAATLRAQADSYTREDNALQRALSLGS